MMSSSSFRQRIRSGQSVNFHSMPMDSTRDQVHELLQREPCDFIYIDCQHGPYTEWDIARICSAAEELSTPVQLRIKHTRHAYRIGNYLDLGPLCIKVPEVEEEAVVDEAINAFYYPPIGRRSWGGNVGYNKAAFSDRRAYADWWNDNGVLGIKIESIRAVLTVRALAKPLVTYVDFGPADLQFDMDTHPHPYLKTLDDCMAFVQKQLRDTHVRMLEI